MTMKIIEKVYESMPEFFSGKSFVKELRLQGYPESLVQNNHYREFLALHCTSQSRSGCERKSMYLKNGFVKNYLQKPIEFSQVEKEDVQKCIEILKKHGYKIMKPTTNYEEI